MAGEKPRPLDQDFAGDWMDRFGEPPGMEVKVYRRRLDDHKLWEYLGRYGDEYDIQLEDLASRTPDDLGALLPLERTRLEWGGGQYQFRLFWRDEHGQRRMIRSRDQAIEGWSVER